MREYLSAHAAVWAVHSTFREYFWRVWRRGHPTEIASNDVLDAARELDSRWCEIRDELKEVADFDCDSMRQAVQAESKAAIERCRQSIIAPSADEIVRDEHADPIPPERRTRPLTKTQAAKYLGYDHERPDMAVDRRMKNGKLPYMPVPNETRRYYFDMNKFSPKVWLEISPNE